MGNLSKVIEMHRVLKTLGFFCVIEVLFITKSFDCPCVYANVRTSRGSPREANTWLEGFSPTSSHPYLQRRERGSVPMPNEFINHASIRNVKLQVGGASELVNTFVRQEGGAPQFHRGSGAGDPSGPPLFIWLFISIPYNQLTS